ncbi:MAG: Dam family site-specific DNA-(adenine-N6)-methyltransferase [Nitrospira sp.]
MATRPILRWAGSKRKLLPSLMDYVPAKYERYVEPFLGSGCFFLALRPSASVLGDFNRGLMEMYSVLRDSPLKLARAVYAMPNTTRYYYKLRSHVVADLTPLERAARFVYLNRYCFNGVYRENRQGMFNVPRGSHTGKLPTIEEFKVCAEVFKSADLRPGDFEECLKDARSGDFIYLDPPYASCTRLDHGEYGYNSFNEKDIPRLISTLKAADRKGAAVLLSYANTPLLKRVLPKWNFRKVRVRRNVAGFAHQRLEVSEILVSNYPLPRKPIGVS